MTSEEWNDLKEGQVIYRYDRPIKILKVNAGCITVERKRVSKYNKDGTVYCKNDKYMFFLQPIKKKIISNKRKFKGL